MSQEMRDSAVSTIHLTDCITAEKDVELDNGISQGTPTGAENFSHFEL